MSAEDQAKLALTEWLVGELATHCNSTAYLAGDDNSLTLDGQFYPMRIAADIIDQWADLIHTVTPALAEWQEKPTLDELRGILAGIDSDETRDDYGWWETSSGADFGADKLAEVLNWGERALGLPVTDQHIHHWVNHRLAKDGLPPVRCRCGAMTD